VIPNPRNNPVSTFCIAFYIFVIGEHVDFTFGTPVDRSKSQPTDDQVSLKGRDGHDLEGHSPIASFLKCDISYLWRIVLYLQIFLSV